MTATHRKIIEDKIELYNTIIQTELRNIEDTSKRIVSHGKTIATLKKQLNCEHTMIPLAFSLYGCTKCSLLTDNDVS